MPNICISANFDKLREMRDRKMSPSRVFQMGLDIALDGGMDVFTDLKIQNKSLKEKIEILQMKVESLEMKLKSSQDQHFQLQREYMTLKESVRS